VRQGAHYRMMQADSACASERLVTVG